MHAHPALWSVMVIASLSVPRSSRRRTEGEERPGEGWMALRRRLSIEHIFIHLLSTSLAHVEFVIFPSQSIEQ